MEVASGLFRKHGVDAVSVAEVMTEAGMTQGGFYRHFASKEALAVEACAQAFAKATANWGEVVNSAQAEGANASEAIIRYYLAPKPADRRCPMIAFASEATRRADDDLFKAAYRDGTLGLKRVFDAAAGPSHSTGPSMAFAAMVGANMLAMAGFHDASREDPST